MKIATTTNTLSLVDAHGCLWLLGGVFVLSGSAAILAGFLASNADKLRWWERAIVFAIGAGHLGGGLVTMRAAPATRFHLDAVANTGTIEIAALWTRPRVERFALDDFHNLELRVGKDSDGDATYHLWMWLRDGRRFPLHGVPMQTRTGCDDAERALRTWLAGARSGSP